jgi:hypothetical protein
MKPLFWISLSGFLLGIAGLIGNVVTGFSLTRQVAADSDLHLTIALSSVALVIFSGMGLVFASQRRLSLLQEKTLLTKQSESPHLGLLSEKRSQAVYFSIFVMICCVINLVSGTISQAGRFPLIHGLFGFLLVGLSVMTLSFWIRLALKLEGYLK